MSLVKASATSLALGLAAATGLWSAPAWAACTLVSSQPDVDFGTLKRDTLQVNGNLATLGERTLSLDLQCDVESDLTLFYRAAAQDGEGFRFGPQGHYQLRVRDAVVDGVPVDLGEIGVNRGVIGRTDRSMHWRPEHGVAPVKEGRVVRGTSLQAHIDITALAPLAATRVRDETQWLAPALIETFAGEASRELSLTATLIPVACTPVLSSGGRVDYGRRSVSTFNRATTTMLPTQRVTLTVNCDALALFALGTVDNRNGSALIDGNGYFGLGLSGGNPVGHYALALSEIQADDWGGATALLALRGSTTWDSVGQEVPLLQASLVGFARTAGTGGPDELAQLTSVIEVSPLIAPMNDLDVSEDIDLDGSATIEIVYL
ncbi:DUF1120 domain-containing protein [Pseudomonas sp. dw_358]|uniref:DUF1120 domain-containing protein n=1 Tax=Pseudomonas sp. dw_358 TaxID=2720083 RepID=UPI001BD4E516|nr:DUF1120 domain-containing protein [Pseudomonas sp. dw_358]